MGPKINVTVDIDKIISSQRKALVLRVGTPVCSSSIIVVLHVIIAFIFVIFPVLIHSCRQEWRENLYRFRPVLAAFRNRDKNQLVQLPSKQIQYKTIYPQRSHRHSTTLTTSQHRYTTHSIIIYPTFLYILHNSQQYI